ncbi:MAG TPA: PAS domain S-box protein [Burkholderiales bacterium]|nr:PAS domain S-box protein [Burkholderiales bacterium]
MKTEDLLRESENLLTAVANGEVDAFVIGRDDNRRVLLLANAYQRYRQLVERMQQGAVTLSGDSRVLYANQRFADMVGMPLSQLYTIALDSLVSVADRARIGTFLLISARDSRMELDLRRRDGTAIPVVLSHAAVSDGYTTLLVSDQRPLQWPALAGDALDSIRIALEHLNRSPGLDPQAREALESISEQINALARMSEEMVDVQRPPPHVSASGG